MNPSERGEIVVTARLLAAASRLYWVPAGLLVVSAAALMTDAGNRGAAIAATVFGIASNMYSFRIIFDASLFEDILAGTLSTKDLDDVLGALGKPRVAGRTWADRCRGARRLIVHAAVATAGQVVAVIVTGLS